MDNTFSLEQITQTGNLDSIFIFRQYKLNLMPWFMEMKSINPNLKQDRIAEELGCSSSTLQRYRNVIYMFSSYKIP